MNNNRRTREGILYVYTAETFACENITLNILLITIITAIMGALQLFKGAELINFRIIKYKVRGYLDTIFKYMTWPIIT